MVVKRSSSKKPLQKPRPKNTPVIALTGTPPQAKQTWWSQRFIEVLESFKMGSRLARGKAYAEESKVLKLAMSRGIVTATVQGSRKASYRVSIRLEPLSDSAWKQVTHNLTRKAIYAVELLQDQMPQDIEEVFAAAHVSLFPARLEELESSCDCPDWSNPCKHIAATYYILAQHFDLDPFLIFVWRGRLKTQIIEFLRNYWRTGKPKSNGFGSNLKKVDEEDYERYWFGNLDVSESTPLNPFSDAVPDSSVRKLGPSPVQLDGQDIAEILADAYTTTSDLVRSWALDKSAKTKIVLG
ncbi:SWIM zinc finger family protein [Sulfidibacter corallicola]|uniref:SWIM zinc finger family protein n=1 Tax=Sulfidibacter corallicola TaxID=2818388 RepID=A0A8A4U3H2_SULCO|nr:SWIM zinc finger family protein [Sulfidibacter corallicola]QTD53295.1 SWIM zinc finger family protein [Sulfidibacter corallicola]